MHSKLDSKQPLATSKLLFSHRPLSTPSGLLDRFSEWQQVYEEQTFKSTQVFVTSGPAVEVIQIWLSCQKCVLSRLELQGLQKEIDANDKSSVYDMQS